MDRPILGIDTASRRGSVALAGVPSSPSLGLIEGARHAGDLMPAIESLLAQAGLVARDLGGIGVTCGPGSFTGLRIGLSTAKGLGFALDIAVEGLSTLEAIARAAEVPTDALTPEVCALIEAGRGEVYAARFGIDRAGARRLGPDAAFKPEDLARSLPSGTILAGEAAARLLTDDPPRFRVVPIPLLAPAVAAWAYGVIPAGARYRPGGPSPNYVRPSDTVAARPPA